MQPVRLASEADTQALGARLAALAQPGDILALMGGLGAGKTTLARAFVRAYVGNPLEDVPSPTFTLVQMYEGAGGACWHFDLYRLERPQDALELDIEEAFKNAVSLIEWPERLGGFLPERALKVMIEIEGKGDGESRLARLDGWPDRLKESS